LLVADAPTSPGAPSLAINVHRRSATPIALVANTATLEAPASVAACAVNVKSSKVAPMPTSCTYSA
jgi:hypothetical protein